MRTSALWILLLAAPAFAEEAVVDASPTPSRFELGLPAEVTLVGLTAGVRPEVLFRFGEPGTRSRLRAAVGFLAGPDHFFLPVSLGYRAVYRQGPVVQPLLGVGLEGQLRLVSDFPPVRSFGLYLEGGVGFALDPHWSLSALLCADVMVAGAPGFGIGPRVTAGYRF